ncbi:MAG: DUF3078 domain-containing protein [Flavipsychrobacter sp.]|nr:DUF3078 domain-containing protein [Flavipsychrobacter sp.]
MKKLLLVLLPILSTGAVYAQLSKTDEVKKELQTENKDTVLWSHGGSVNIGINEGFLHNWPAGGEIASLVMNGVASGFLTHFDHNNIWTNNITLAYGLNYTYSNNFVPRKTDDRIDFTSKYGTKVHNSKDFYFTGLFNGKTQFTKGYNYTATNWKDTANSAFFSPAYLTLAAGMEYRKGSDISLFLSPIAARDVLVSRFYTMQSPVGAFGVPYGKTSKFDLGAYFSGRYVLNINKNTIFKTRLDLYTNYLAKDRTDPTGNVIKDNPGNIKVLWDNMFTWKATKYLGLALGATFVYDNDVPYINKTPETSSTPPGNNLGWLQVSQVFTLGVIYTF